MQDLWDFAVALYGYDGIETICLEWQDQYGVDVTMLLHACWVGEHGHGLAHEQIVEIDEALREWRTESVEPLRRLRRTLKKLIAHASMPTERNKVRELVKSAELQAERVSLLILEAIPLAERTSKAEEQAVLRNILVTFQFFSGAPATRRDLNAAEYLAKTSQLVSRGSV